jgi:hypothetical protein
MNAATRALWGRPYVFSFESESTGLGTLDPSLLPAALSGFEKAFLETAVDAWWASDHAAEPVGYTPAMTAENVADYLSIGDSILSSINEQGGQAITHGDSPITVNNLAALPWLSIDWAHVPWAAIPWAVLGPKEIAQLVAQVANVPDEPPGRVIWVPSQANGDSAGVWTAKDLSWSSVPWLRVQNWTAFPWRKFDWSLLADLLKSQGIPADAAGAVAWLTTFGQTGKPPAAQSPNGALPLNPHIPSAGGSSLGSKFINLPGQFVATNTNLALHGRPAGSGGSQAGGSQAGGSQAGGSQAGGSQAGGSQAGGSQAGGSQAGGATASGNVSSMSAAQQAVAQQQAEADAQTAANAASGTTGAASNAATTSPVAVVLTVAALGAATAIGGVVVEHFAKRSSRGKGR